MKYRQKEDQRKSQSNQWKQEMTFPPFPSSQRRRPHIYIYTPLAYPLITRLKECQSREYQGHAVRTRSSVCRPENGEQDSMAFIATNTDRIKNQIGTNTTYRGNALSYLVHCRVDNLYFPTIRSGNKLSVSQHAQFFAALERNIEENEIFFAFFQITLKRFNLQKDMVHNLCFYFIAFFSRGKQSDFIFCLITNLLYDFHKGDFLLQIS